VARGGADVTGCDSSPGVSARALEAFGVKILDGHDPSHVEGMKLVVATAAVPGDHPELVAARRADIPVVKRAEALGAWVNAGQVVAISGTHGKTTTTAMTTGILVEAGLSPTGFVGGRVPGWNGNLCPGGDDLFVVEADEYDRSFHQLRPAVAVVTNLEADHLDIYGDLEGVREAFRTFLAGVREGGVVLVCADDPGASRLLAELGGPGRSFGFSAGSQLRGAELEATVTKTRFRVFEDGKDVGHLAVPIPGSHNALNALASAGAARALGVEWDAIRRALANFPGVQRRFQKLGSVNGITVVDDYAHHPTELAAAIAAARQFYPESRLVVVFEPHLYSRTRDFVGEFAHVLAGADVVWVTEIYPAREAPIPGVDAALLAGRIRALRGAGVPVVEVLEAPSLDKVHDDLAAFLEPGDLCLTLGAGTIERVGPELVCSLESAHGGAS